MESQAKGYCGNIEDETQRNTDYRRVLYTSKHMQLVVMTLKPNEEIGEEVHTVDQFFRFETGRGVVIINSHRHEVSEGFGVIVPAGSRHNVINTSSSDLLTLYSLYAPPQHKDGTVHAGKSDETEEHFDGKTTE